MTVLGRLDPRRWLHRSGGAREPGGSVLLAAVVTVVWTGVLLVTQVVAVPALDASWTVLAGLALTVPLIVGYPSALRGPRFRRRGLGGGAAGDPAPGDDGRGGAAIAAMGRPLPYLRQGLNQATADRTARALRPLVGDGRCTVVLTGTTEVLGWVGPGRRAHGTGTDLPEPLREIVETGRPGTLLPDGGAADDTDSPVDGSAGQVGRSRRCGLNGCSPSCPLGPGVAVPLVVRDRAVGSLAVLAAREEALPDATQVSGLAGLLSLHLELAELDREAQLAADARLDALRAQINPHFLFNTLNTIASKARTDPTAARQLLLRLADFFRYSTRQDGQFAEFAQEYFFVRTYLALEQARFGDRLEVRYDIDPQVLGVQVPVLVIQPLVENAVRHGLTAKGEGGTVTLRARVDPLARATAITVHDNGTGMEAETLRRLVNGVGVNGAGADGHGSDDGGGDGRANGIGLANISRRLDNLFADQYSLDIRSRPDNGTTVELRLPVR